MPFTKHVTDCQKYCTMYLISVCKYLEYVPSLHEVDGDDLLTDDGPFLVNLNERGFLGLKGQQLRQRL